MKTAIIIPTRNEAANAPELLRRIGAALRPHDLADDVEVLFVDDGEDDLPEIATAHAADLGLSVRVIRRTQPTGGLAGAVVDGIRRTSAPVVVVCDGDLQHPPELIPTMLQRIGSADLVVASRYVRGGDSAGLGSRSRHLVSRASCLVSRMLFPRRLYSCTDPMSGFFAVRRSALDLQRLRPQGFKILLEIIARSRPMSMEQVPLAFEQRRHGTSHADPAEGMRFLRQLVSLRLARQAGGRAALFMLVGLSGVVPNLVTLRLLERSGASWLVASVLAIQVAILWCFLGAELLVWRGHRAGRSLPRRLAGYVLVAETDLGRVPFVAVLIDLARIGSTTATLVTLAAAFSLRFWLADRVVYSQRPAKGAVSVARDVAPTRGEQPA